MSDLNESYSLDDAAIAAIAKLLQVAIITGTDIVDNIRTLRLRIEGTKINITPEFTANFNAGIESMLKQMDCQDCGTCDCEKEKGNNL